MKKLFNQVAKLIEEVLGGTYQVEVAEHLEDLVGDIQKQVDDIQVLCEYEVITVNQKWELVGELEEVFEKVTNKCFAHYIEVEQEEE